MTTYRRQHARRQRFLTAVEARYASFRDAAGFVLVLIGTPCACMPTPTFRLGRYYSLPTLRPGRIYRLHWTHAAQLEAGHFGELLEVPVPAGERFHVSAWGWTSLTPPEPTPRAPAQPSQATSVRQITKMVTAIARTLPKEGLRRDGLS